MIEDINAVREPWDQAAHNEEKIKSYGPGFVHHYCQHEWRQWTGNGYIKSHYDVKLPDGTVIKHQWPNAGKIAGFESGVLVKLSDTSPWQDDEN